MVKPWLFEFFRSPSEEGMLVPNGRAGVTPEEAAKHFAHYWDLWTRAEGLGFEGIFFSEHHFGPGYSPSPNLLIAALAPVTKTLRLGVMGNVLPYYQVWRVIEEIGMLDHLTGGRLEIGTASGIPPEMAQIGLGVAEANERNIEAQDLLDWALTHPGQPLTHHGKYWNFDNLTLVPGLRQAAPSRWTTVVSEGSAARAGKRGTKVCTGFNSVERVKATFDAHRIEAEKAGRKADADWYGLRRVTIVSENGSEARDLAEQVKEQIRNIFLKHDDRVNHGPVPDAPQKSHGGMQMSDDEYIAGSPAEVAEQIIEQCRATGAGHFLAMLDHEGSPAEHRRVFDLYGREVIPLLRKAAAPARAPAETVG